MSIWSFFVCGIVSAPAGGAAVLHSAQPEAHLSVCGSSLRSVPVEELLLHSGQQRSYTHSHAKLRLQFSNRPVGDDVFWLCADGSLNWRSFSPLRLLALGGIVISVCTLSFGPFIAMVMHLSKHNHAHRHTRRRVFIKLPCCCFRVSSLRSCPGSSPLRGASVMPTGPPTSGPCTTCWTSSWWFWVRLTCA